MSDASQPAADRLCAEFLTAIDDGQAPDLEQFAERIDEPTQRAEFRDLVTAARWARARFPAPFRAEVVVDQRYRLLRKLGAGGYGAVWLAEDQRLRRDVALKLVSSLEEPQRAERALRNEVALLAKLAHRGVVRLYDTGVHDGTLYLTMEHVPGRSLADLLGDAGQGPWPPSPATLRRQLACPPNPGETALWGTDWSRFAAQLAIELCLALAAAHGRDIVHRDLKPGNVMITGDGRPVLLDFGIAGLRDQAAGTITQGLFGTAAYLAPEQLDAGRSGKSVQVDVYQLGAILYELLTGRRAFGDAPQEQLLQQIRDGQFPPPSRLVRCAPELEDVVLKAMARDPAKRYPSVDALRVDLERWLEGSQPAASRGGAPMRTWRRLTGFVWRRRRPLILVLAALTGGVPAYCWRSAPPLGAVRRLDQAVELEMASEGYVTATAIYADAATTTGLQAAELLDETGAAQPFLRLGKGTHPVRVRVAVPNASGPVDSTLTIRFRASADRSTAEATVRFQSALADAVAASGRVATLAEAKALQDKVNAPNRGGEPVAPFDLDALLREAK